MTLHDFSLQNHTDMVGGRFPVPSFRHNEYCLIMLSEDTGYIHIEVMKSRHAAEYTRAYRQGIDFYASKGFKPKYERLDNETSKQLEEYCIQQGITIQYVPPGNHRANSAERAIRTFSNHFVATLATTDPSFPLGAWDLLIPQAEMTLNLMRPSKVTKHISAWSQLHGAYSFDAHPMAPPGAKVTVHERPQSRPAYGVHGVDGYYVAPAMQHYRSYEIFLPSTQAVRISDTIEWHLHRVVLPCPTPLDTVTSALHGLTRALKDMIAPSSAWPATAWQQRALVSNEVPTLTKSLERLHDIFSADPAHNSSSQEQHTEEQRVLDVTARQTTPGVEEQRVPAPPAASMTPPPGLTRPAAQPPAAASEHPALATDADSAIQQHAQGRKRRRRKTKDQQAISQQTAAGNNGPCTQTTRAGRTISTPARFRSLPAMQRAYTAIDLDPNGKPLTYASCMRGSDKELWQAAAAEEFTRLVKTDTIRFISWKDKPTDRSASYYNPQVKIKIKEGKVVRRVRGTIGGDRVDYPGPVAASTADLTTIKLLLNSVVSDDAEWMTADITDFYLGTPLPRKEYMRIGLNQIPQSTQQQYNVRQLAGHDNTHVLVEISKGIYGLPQAGKLAQERLLAHLATHGYEPAANTPCLFKHTTRDIMFALVVDDFGIRYKGKENADHLLAALRELYPITVDWEGTKYVGISIHYDRPRRRITLSMPNYINNAIKRFGLDTDSDKGTSANSPAEIQEMHRTLRGQPQPTAAPDTSPKLDQQDIKRIQQIVGVLLYYTRAVDPSMLTAVSRLASMQAAGTVKVRDAANRLLRYAARWENAAITYKPSNMQLIAYSDASHGSETESRSRAGGVLYLGSHEDTNIVNGSILAISTVIDVLCPSVAEAEYAALFTVSTEAVSVRHTLQDMGYSQPPTLIFCDNTCAVGIANDAVKQRRSRAMDLRFHWIRDRVRQGHFKVTWKAGYTNLADFFTKPFGPAKHTLFRKYLVCYPSRKNDDENVWKGCDDLSSLSSPDVEQLSSQTKPL
jgi:hypothetical protein